jgi:hypothetical protein
MISNQVENRSRSLDPLADRRLLTLKDVGTLWPAIKRAKGILGAKMTIVPDPRRSDL